MTDAKPATDEQIAAMRAYLKVEGPPSRWSRHTVIILIARIDKEIEDRLAAEARVKVLREALRALLDGCIALDGEEAILPMQMSKARAALKEPANG